jgi:hypothetical protein
MEWVTHPSFRLRTCFTSLRACSTPHYHSLRHTLLLSEFMLHCTRLRVASTPSSALSHLVHFCPFSRIKLSPSILWLLCHASPALWRVCKAQTFFTSPTTSRVRKAYLTPFTSLTLTIRACTHLQPSCRARHSDCGVWTGVCERLHWT